MNVHQLPGILIRRNAVGCKQPAREYWLLSSQSVRYQSSRMQSQLEGCRRRKRSGRGNRVTCSGAKTTFPSGNGHNSSWWSWISIAADLHNTRQLLLILTWVPRHYTTGASVTISSWDWLGRTWAPCVETFVCVEFVYGSMIICSWFLFPLINLFLLWSTVRNSHIVCNSISMIAIVWRTWTMKTQPMHSIIFTVFITRLLQVGSGSFRSQSVYTHSDCQCSVPWLSR